MPDHIPEDLTRFEAELARLYPSQASEPSLERLLYEAGAKSVPRRSNLVPWSIAATLFLATVVATTAYVQERTAVVRLADVLASQGRRLENLERTSDEISVNIAESTRPDPSGYATLKARLISGSDVAPEPDVTEPPADRTPSRPTSARRASLDL